SADIGRWLALDRAIWIGRIWRPWSRRGPWLRARARLRDRVLSALADDGSLPQTYDGEPTADASGLMAVVFGLLRGDDPRAARLVDATMRQLDSGPCLYRYLPREDDGFHGLEATFLPAAFWLVSALAQVGRLDEAVARMGALDDLLPPLMAEEYDVAGGRSLGNVPLVWSHMEATRALYILDAAALRRRRGGLGLGAWRVARYARVRSRRGLRPPPPARAPGGGG
ncbi:MAG: hypothetical protein ABR541_05895, partial [Candidatus Dormibacteria bacterium]